MRRIGLVVALLGLMVVVYALKLPTTLEDQASRILGMVSSPDQGVFNIGLLHQQMMVFTAGVALSVVGGVLIAAGQVVASVRSVVREAAEG